MAEDLTARESLKDPSGRAWLEEERSLFSALEERIDHLLIKYQNLVKENDRLLAEVEEEKEKRIRLEKSLELFSQDREKVKTRIDQLLVRLRNIDL